MSYVPVPAFETVVPPIVEPAGEMTVTVVLPIAPAAPAQNAQCLPRGTCEREARVPPRTVEVDGERGSADAQRAYDFRRQRRAQASGGCRRRTDHDAVAAGSRQAEQVGAATSRARGARVRIELRSVRFVDRHRRVGSRIEVQIADTEPEVLTRHCREHEARRPARNADCRGLRRAVDVEGTTRIEQHLHRRRSSGLRGRLHLDEYGVRSGNWQRRRHERLARAGQVRVDDQLACSAG